MTEPSLTSQEAFSRNTNKTTTDETTLSYNFNRCHDGRNGLRRAIRLQ